MKDCSRASADYAPLDPNQRVNYSFGMVLGVTDFSQEQVNRGWQQRLSNRLLHGYGTVCGLAVAAQALPGGLDVEIQVAPGYALSPQGRWIWLEEVQCGRLNQWLQQHRGDFSPPPGAGPLHVAVTLSYAECPAELVPIAGHACASAEDTRTYSRIVESFRLQFAWQPPPQPYEAAMRTLADLLRRLVITPAPVSPPVDDSALLLDLVAQLGLDSSPPLLSPALPPALQIPQDRAYDTLCRLLTLWVTDVCPRLEPLAPRQGPTQDGDLLLAEIGCTLDAGGNLAVAVDAQGRLLPGVITIDQQARPVLVPDRLKQALACLLGQL
jgi:hypothetical protein